MGLFGRADVQQAFEFGAVPDGAEARESAAADALSEVLRPEAKGTPFLPSTGHLKAVAAVRHYFPDVGERREVLATKARELMFLAKTFPVPAGAENFFDHIDHLLGVDDAACRAHGVKNRDARVGVSIAEDSKFLGIDLDRGSGELLHKWQTDDQFVTGTLATTIVIFGRLGIYSVDAAT